MRARAWGPPTCVVVLLGCQLLVDVEGAADGGVANVVDGDGASISNDAGQADAGLVRCPAARAGPDLVPTDGFCIDRTEVSAHQYDEFLSADKGGIALPPACDGHSSYAPLVGAPSPDHPVLVAWCDA